VVLGARRVARLEDLEADVTGEAGDGVGDARDPLLELTYPPRLDAARDVHRHGRVFDSRTLFLHGYSIASHLGP
jgi:hypothetical protein